MSFDPRSPVVAAGVYGRAADEGVPARDAAGARARSWWTPGLWITLGALGVVHAVYAYGLRVNSDESQHLHVAWSLSQGLVGYRDVFDNHAPLFHLLYAPCVRWVGERADALVRMRLSILPLTAISLLATASIARSLLGEERMVWAMVLAALNPLWFVTSSEFRADGLWAAAWLCGMALLLARRSWSRGDFATGLAFGIALATSFKTTVLLAALAFAVAGTLIAMPSSQRHAFAARLRSAWPALCAGLVLPVLLVLAWVAQQRALDDFYADAVLHNVLPGLGAHGDRTANELLVPISFTLVVAAVATWARRAPSRIDGRTLLAFLWSVAYLLLIEGCWPLVTAQDFMPWSPVAIVASIAVLGVGFRGTERWPFHLLATLCAATEIFLVRRYYPWQPERVDRHRDVVAEVLALTAPGEPVLDLKGEALFRPRPVTQVYETITRERLRRELLADDAPERTIASHTYVAMPDEGRWPARTRAFLAAHFVPVGAVRVAGQLLRSSGTGEPIVLEIAVPGRYALVTPSGRAVEAKLDGVSYDGPRDLTRGRHELIVAGAPTDLAVLWAHAVELGFSPFHPANQGDR